MDDLIGSPTLGLLFGHLFFHTEGRREPERPTLGLWEAYSEEPLLEADAQGRVPGCVLGDLHLADASPLSDAEAKTDVPLHALAIVVAAFIAVAEGCSLPTKPFEDERGIYPTLTPNLRDRPGDPEVRVPELSKLPALDLFWSQYPLRP